MSDDQSRDDRDESTEDSASGAPVDPALADAVESAFEDVRSELGGDPQTELGEGEPAPAAGEAADVESDGEPLSELEQAKAEAAQAQDDLARSRADLYNLQQEYQGFVRRSREGAAGHRAAGQASVVEALIPVLDEIELARQHGDLTGTFETTATKLETLLADKFGLERFGEVGEAFDPQLHEALMAVESSEVTEPTVAMVLQPGYKLGEKVVRAARVQVSNPA